MATTAIANTTSTEPTSELRNMYEQQIDQYSSEEQGWVQFVRDHYRYLRNTAQQVSLDAFRQHTMRYRLEDFIEDEFKMMRSTAWIVLMVNQLNSNVDFRNLEFLYIPDMTAIDYLRNRYDTVVANQENL